MRRSRMPVRVRIHSSFVSTSLSRSALVSRSSGKKCPTAVMAARGMAWRWVEEGGRAGERGGALDQARDGAGRRPAVPDEHGAVDPEQRRPAVLLVVERPRDVPEHALDQPDLLRPEPLLPDLGADELGEDGGQAL